MAFCDECALSFKNPSGEPESDTEKLDTVDDEPQQSENKELEALKIIRDTCSRYSGCIGCPYVNNNNTCGVNKYTPSKWILKGDKEIENRLFV